MKIRGIAHRGYPAKFPENTLSSFQAALDHNFTHVELDVHLTKDGVPVVIHDYTVDRTTGASGRVDEFTLEKIQSLTVTKDEKIPTLEEVLRLLKGDTTILVELKQAGDLYQGLEEKVIDVIHRTDTSAQCMLISFDHFSIAKAKQLDESIRMGITSSNSMPYVFPFMEEIDVELLGVPIHLMTKEYDTMIREKGIESGPWPVNTSEQMNEILEKYPSSLITTDELEKWAEFYKAHSELHKE